MLLLEAPENEQLTVPRHMSGTSTDSQFHNFANSFSLPVYDETKLQYSNSPWTHRNLNAHPISAAMQVFVCDCRKGNILFKDGMGGFCL
jgi:hypothetical protein